VARFRAAAAGSAAGGGGWRQPHQAYRFRHSTEAPPRSRTVGEAVVRNPRDARRRRPPQTQPRRWQAVALLSGLCFDHSEAHLILKKCWKFVS
jgi:hypothetical protein